MTVARPIWLQNLSNYSADEFRTLIDAAFPLAGVINNAAVVSPNGPVAANVLVSTGYVVVGAKSAANGKYLVEITATEVVTITANSSGNPRIDNIVVEVDDTAFSDASDVAVVKAVAGTPAGSPVAPALLANQTLLAQVAVANGFSTIVAANITDKRVSADIGSASSGFSGTALKGTYNPAKPILHAYGHITGTSDGTNGFTTGIATPAATTSILTVTTGQASSAGAFNMYRSDQSSLIITKFQTRNMDTTGAAVASKAYDIAADIAYQV